MNLLVLDASIVMSWLFKEEGAQASTHIITFLQKGQAVVPELWLTECLNVLAIAKRTRRLAPSDIEKSLGYLASLPILYDAFSAKILRETVYPMAIQYQLTTYDATYLELAKRRKLPLATLDKALRVAAKKEKITLL